MTLRQTKTFIIPVQGATIKDETLICPVWNPKFPPQPEPDTVSPWILERIDEIGCHFPYTCVRLHNEWNATGKLSADAGLRLWAATRRIRRRQKWLDKIAAKY